MRSDRWRSAYLADLVAAARAELPADLDPAVAKAVVLAVLRRLADPHKRMLRAMVASLSLENRPTPEWLTSTQKHRVRWRAALGALLGDELLTKSDDAAGAGSEAEL